MRIVNKAKFWQRQEGMEGEMLPYEKRWNISSSATEGKDKQLEKVKEPEPV